MVRNFPLPSFATVTLGCSGISAFSILRCSSFIHSGDPPAKRRRLGDSNVEMTEASWETMARELLPSSLTVLSVFSIAVFSSPSGNPSTHVSWYVMTALNQLWRSSACEETFPISSPFMLAMAASRSSLASWRRSAQSLIAAFFCGVSPLTSPDFFTALSISLSVATMETLRSSFGFFAAEASSSTVFDSVRSHVSSKSVPWHSVRTDFSADFAADDSAFDFVPDFLWPSSFFMTTKYTTAAPTAMRRIRMITTAMAILRCSFFLLSALRRSEIRQPKADKKRAKGKKMGWEVWLLLEGWEPCPSICLADGWSGTGVVGREDRAVLYGDSRYFERVAAGLGGDDGELAGHRHSGDDVAALEDGGGVAEDVIDGAVDVAFPVELAERVATAWWFSGPAVFSKAMSRAKKPSPETADADIAVIGSKINGVSDGREVPRPVSRYRQRVTLVSSMDPTNVVFMGPVEDSNPSKHVALFVIAALRNAFASAIFRASGDALSRETDFFNDETGLEEKVQDVWANVNGNGKFNGVQTSIGMGFRLAEIRRRSDGIIVEICSFSCA
nr:hypothetical protein MIMGU_mgv1a022106mg [Ipomoea trifida]